MRKFMLAALLGVALAAPSGALAGGGNPGGTGPPSQSCQEIEAAGGRTPGHANELAGLAVQRAGNQQRTRRHGRPALQREVAVRRGLLPRLAALSSR